MQEAQEWFKRSKENIVTTADEQMDIPEGLWMQCPNCKKTLQTRNVIKNQYVCEFCDHHMRISSEEYFGLLFDEGQYTETYANLTAADPLNFNDSQPYPKRLADAFKKTGLRDAVRTANGLIFDQPVTIACMDFRFIGGSMGSVVGEKICRAIDDCIANKTPLLIISKSGGARMMEGAFSLMQMAKISAKLALLGQAQLPFISLLTDPTTGGVTASYAMLGDLNVAEPNALIGFAGPRVVRETIGRDLPDGFQRSEFLLEHGFIDYIAHRHELKKKLSASFKMLAQFAG